MPTQRVETPEGLFLELELAGAGSRFAASLVDLTIHGAGLAVALVLLDLLAQVDPFGGTQFLAAFFCCGVFVLIVLAQSLTHHLRRGVTPGKALFGLRVVGLHGEQPNFVALLLRSSLWVIELMPIPISMGLLILSLNDRRQRLGDLVAGTLVIRNQAPASHTEPWSKDKWSTLDPRELPLSLALVRALDRTDLDYLRRVIQRKNLPSLARSQLNRQVAQSYCDRLGLTCTADPRTAVREIYLCLREALQA